MLGSAKGNILEAGLTEIIQGCKKGDRASQKDLYKRFYSYSMKICVRYAQNDEEAKEILNDSFVKVFKKIDRHYDLTLSFKAWLNKILVNTAIDHFRKYQHQVKASNMESLHVSYEDDTIDRLSAEEILALVRELPPAYRLAFNLYVVEGYKHHEIAQQLDISEGTSKSNLFKARMHLQAKVHQLYKEKKSSYG